MKLEILKEKEIIGENAFENTKWFYENVLHKEPPTVDEFCDRQVMYETPYNNFDEFAENNYEVHDAKFISTSILMGTQERVAGGAKVEEALDESIKSHYKRCDKKIQEILKIMLDK